MKMFTLSELIGKSIHSVRYSYQSSNKYYLQEFHCYIKLSNGIIIEIPVFDNEDFYELSDENIYYYNKCYENAEEIIDAGKERIYRQIIENIYFCYDGDEVDFLKRAYLKLGNGLYITENNFAPPGITDVDLLIFNQSEFDKRIVFLKESVKPYLV